jgi:serine/threonine-protein kinase
VIQSLLEKNPEKRPFNARSVQGALMNLGETPTSLQPVHQTSKNDVAAADAGVQGLERLKGRIQRRFENPRRDVSWTTLALMALFLVGLVWLASYFAK